MINTDIQKTCTRYDLQTGNITGADVVHAKKHLGDIIGIFENKEAALNMKPDTVVYEVSSHCAVSEGTAGGLFFGTSCVHPGRVGNEYFMTKGHFHSKRECAEYYWGISGEGVLLLISENGESAAEKVEKGSIHYIGGYIAHRLVNTGNADLVVGACWPSDAGHDYGAIAETGFTFRVVEEFGKPMLKGNNAYEHNCY